LAQLAQLFLIYGSGPADIALPIGADALTSIFCEFLLNAKTVLVISLGVSIDTEITHLKIILLIVFNTNKSLPFIDGISVERVESLGMVDGVVLRRLVVLGFVVGVVLGAGVTTTLQALPSTKFLVRLSVSKPWA